MSSTTQIRVHPLLKPGILEWDVSAKYVVPTGRRKKSQEPATTPPTRSMTFMVPGFPFHLQPLQPSPDNPAFITVSDVLHYLHCALAARPLDDEQYTAVQGMQKDVARAVCCMRNRINYESQSDAYFKQNMRGLDLILEQCYFGGLQHQRDGNSGNVWIVVLQVAAKATPSIRVPHVLSPGILTWDIKDPPPTVKSAQHFDIAGKPMIICDISGHSKLSIPPLTDALDALRPFDPHTVLDAIYAALHAKVHDDEWPFWDPMCSSFMQAAVRHLSISQNNREVTYLEMMPEQRQRFLALWHGKTPDGDDHFTLLTQPSFRPMPRLHRSLKRGYMRWEIHCNPNKNNWTSTAWLDEPATSPGRLAMDIKFEFIPGVYWRLPVYRAHGSPCITLRHLLFCIYEFLVLDKFDISFSKLPLHLKRRILRRADLREGRTAMREDEAPHKPQRMIGPREDSKGIMSKERIRSWLKKPPRVFKRVDTITQVTFVGLEHTIGLLGEDEWKICLKS